MIYRTYYGGGYDATYKIVIFGDSEVPKTQLTQRFLTNLFNYDSKMTIGVDFEVKNLDVANKRVKLQIWDFGGEERFRFLLPTYVRGANGALFIYDVNNYSSLAHLDDWLMVIRKELREEDQFPIIVVGIASELDSKREVPSEEGIKIARSRGVDGFVECSPKTGENVEETFEALTRLKLAKSGIIEMT
ncbi:MAG: Rab family GTPase [Candidatus Odinarchaeota archaeon]